MTSYIASTSYSVDRAQHFMAALQIDPYYLFVADHRPSTNTSLPNITQASSNSYYAPWQQMLFGKQVTTLCLGIMNNPYTYGSVYDQYDDQVDMTSLTPYAIVNAGSYFHVFKCLYNNNGLPSTVQPDFTQAIAANSFFYETSDEYKWMYVCSSNSSLVKDVGTSDFFPLTTNNTVAAAAVSGVVPVIQVEDGGKLYNNHSAGTFQAADVRVNAVQTLYQLSNSQIATTNGYYTGCVLLITGGTGVGQFATVTSYYSTNTGNYANLDSTFLVPPTNGSTWELMPGVTLKSDGTQSVNVVARALVNSLSSNSISSIEVLQPGAGYFNIFNADVTANAVVGVTSTAVVRAILPPPGGHGANQAEELNASVILVGCTLANTEGGKIPATNTYRTIGLLRDPLFANVQVGLTASMGIMTAGEDVSVLNLTFGAANASLNSASVVVQADTRMFTANSLVLFTTAGEQYLATVASVTNSTSMNLTANALFSVNAAANAYAVNVVSNGICTIVTSSSNVAISNVAPFKIGQALYGQSSGGGGTISTINRSGMAKDFTTFVQLNKYAVTMLGGSFIQNETVFQGNTTGLVHSYANGMLYISNQSHPFVVPGNNITGNTSGAIAQPLTAYNPELTVGTGLIEYIETVPVITRSAAESETWIVFFPS